MIVSVVPATRFETSVNPLEQLAPLPSNLRQAGADPSWWQAVTSDLARREYLATTTPTGLQAPNRAQNLRTTFAAGGITVVPRTGKGVAPAWRFAWEASRIGRAGQMQAATSACPESEGARVTYRRDGWSEWYDNKAEGLEQGFTIERRPAGEGPLRIAGHFPAGLRAQARGEGAIDFIDEHGACVIRYGELHAWDAEGEELCSELVAAGGELAIEVDDRGAEYPLTIDPLMTSPAWTAEPDHPSALFGCSVATAGDVNGDGFSDVIVGAWGYDNAQGRAFVYHGSASGLSVAPDWTAAGDQATALFGYAVATAGDVNGDGFSDVIVGANYYDNGQTNEGRAYVYHGSPSGLSLAPTWTAESDQDFVQFGQSVATAGDVNGDGFSDVIVGAPFYDNPGEENEGRAFVYLGSPSGLGVSPGWTAESNQAGAQFGVSVATAGDVNGDGFSDVIVGAWLYSNGQGGEGRAFVYHGSAGGLASSAAWTAESNQANAYFGTSVAGAGDVNGDGYADVIVGAHLYTNGQSGEGRAYVYHGSAGGLLAAAAWTRESDQGDAHFGGSVAPAGDVNGDSYADVIVGAKDITNGQFTEGRAYVYQGSAAGLASSPVWTAESNQISAQFGYSVATAGDVNGDGYSDVIVGAYQYDNGQTDEGRAFVYHGAAAGPSTTAAWTEDSNEVGAGFGFSVATAGDVNGDGFSDVIVGAIYYDHPEIAEGRAFVYYGSAEGLATTPAWTAESDQAGALFGHSVATAGDVNGDGFSDVIVGAYGYDNGELGEGRAFVYHGSAAGLADTAAWTAESDQNDAHFGNSVATAGDVNGDGFSDVIVGAPDYDNGELDEGRAFVYHGSAEGLSTIPAWIEERENAQAEFGTSVATAGDVNGDGFSDVIVGALGYDNGELDEGRAFVYHGSAGGLSLTPNRTVESDQAGAGFGVSVATAGDVNGDGFSDVIVGAWAYDNGSTDEGRAFAYHGSAAGLSTTAAWTAEGDLSGANYGVSVATAGDVNGDGFSDVIVGAWRSSAGFPSGDGQAFVYHGAAAGLATTAAWTAEGDQVNAKFGCSVATAGDVNGDGYSDIIVGAFDYDNGELLEGQAFVFFGNEGRGLDRLPRQSRTDDSAPISLLGSSDSESAFRLTALGRTAAGRGQVRLQFEVKPFGVPFDGSGLGTGAIFDTGTPAPGNGSAVPLTELASGLTAETLYHWRLRIAADSPFFPRTPWLTLAGNALTEADLRTAGTPVSVPDDGAQPVGARLEILPGGPNPAIGRCEVLIALGRPARIRADVLDISGRRVAVLVEDRIYDQGSHRLVWDGRTRSGLEAAAGTYFIRVRSDSEMRVRKTILMP